MQIYSWSSDDSFLRRTDSRNESRRVNFPREQTISEPAFDAPPWTMNPTHGRTPIADSWKQTVSFPGAEASCAIEVFRSTACKKELIARPQCADQNTWIVLCSRNPARASRQTLWWSERQPRAIQPRRMDDWWPARRCRQSLRTLPTIRRARIDTQPSKIAIDAPSILVSIDHISDPVGTPEPARSLPNDIWLSRPLRCMQRPRAIFATHAERDSFLSSGGQS